jgi:NADH dehydrogenase
VVIVGGGFGGLTAAQGLRNASVRVTLVDRSNHHLFQPLLYQVAMAGLSPADIAVPIRSVLRHQENTRVLLANVTRIALDERRVVFEDGEALHYDYLVLATGAATNYFGHDDWAGNALGLKSIEDAVAVRRRVLLAFEAAEREENAEARRRLLTFVVIGGGPTGVEVAGALKELSRFVLADDFRRIRSEQPRVVLVERAERLLTGGFDESLARSARRQLENLGVEVQLGVQVTGIDALGVTIDGERIESTTVLWTAGVHAAELTSTLGAKTDRGRRVEVLNDCSVPGHPEAFVIGDAACFIPKGSDHPLPGVSPVAMQQARFVADLIERRLRDPSAHRTFTYFDKGLMATIGRSRAVAQTGKLKLTGLLAWLAWLLVHIWYLIGFRNRFVVLFNWAWSYVTYKRGARLIPGGTAAAEARALAAQAETKRLAG